MEKAEAIKLRDRILNKLRQIRKLREEIREISTNYDLWAQINESDPLVMEDRRTQSARIGVKLDIEIWIKVNTENNSLTPLE